MKNILCAIDFSEFSKELVELAAAQAAAFECKLWLLHVAEPEPDFVGYTIGSKHDRDWRALTLRKEHRMIQDFAKELESRDLDVTPLLVAGPTVETILRKIGKFEIDLVIMGTHGHGPL